MALICSINIEPFRKNRESKKLNLALGLRVTSNSATLQFTEKNRHPDYLHYGCQSPQWIPQTIEIRVGPWFCDRTYLSSTRLDLRWILLCPNTFCDGSYFVQTLFAMDPTLSKHFLRWILLCPVQTLFAMDPTLSKHFLRWILLCPNTFCDGSYFVQTLFAMEPTQIHLKTLQVRLTGNQGLVSNNLGDFVPSVSKL